MDSNNQKGPTADELLLNLQLRAKTKKEIWDARYLHLASTTAKFSKDPSTKVGAVIVDSKNRIISIGYNGLPRGVKDTHERLHNRDLKYKLILHAEINAILFAQSNVEGCTIYTYPIGPCSKCAALIIQAGISRVVHLDYAPQRWQHDILLGHEILSEASVHLSVYGDTNVYE